MTPGGDRSDLFLTSKRPGRPVDFGRMTRSRSPQPEGRYRGEIRWRNGLNTNSTRRVAASTDPHGTVI